MSRPLEDIIRRWGRWGGDGPAAPQPPTDRCLTFAQAEAAARSEEAPEDARRHVDECDRCRRLVADFRDALAEGPPAEQPAAPVRAAGRTPRLTLRLLRPAALAAAAMVLLAVGAAVYLAVRPPGGPRPAPPPILAGAEVGLREEIESGMTTRGARQFATGEAILFRVDLSRAGHVMLVNIDAAGQVALVPPVPEKPSQLSLAAKQGTALLGPYRLIGEPGQETFLVIATQQAPPDAGVRFEQLRAAYQKHKHVDPLLRLIGTWPGEASVIRLEHVRSRS